MNTQFKAALFSQDTALHHDLHTGFYNDIQASCNTDKQARLNVYRNNIFVSLIDALADIFPVTQTLVGEDFFRAMAKEYILLHPPKTPVINEYGDEFATFIQGFGPAQSLPFLGDLAGLEFCLLAITNEQEHDTLKHQDIAAVFSNTSDPTQLILTLAPSTQLFVSRFAVGSIYQAHQSDTENSLADLQINNSEHLLLAKFHLYAQHHIISPAEGTFINNLMQTKLLGDAVPEEDDFDLGASLAKLIEWKLLTHISASAT